MPSPEHTAPTPTWPPPWKPSEPGPVGCGGPHYAAGMDSVIGYEPPANSESQSRLKSCDFSARSSYSHATAQQFRHCLKACERSGQRQVSEAKGLNQSPPRLLPLLGAVT